MLEDRFEINIRIRDEKELYNPFDKTNGTLSQDVVDYISDRIKDRKIGEAIFICIESEQDIDTEVMKKAFTGYIDLLKAQLVREKRTNMIKQLWMFCIGTLFIAAGLFFADRLPALTGEIISTIGAFSMWEAAGVWIVENPKTRLKKRYIDKLSKTELIFHKTEITYSKLL